ncbi:MAG: hypothetical protein K2X82_25025 [Gemmataceae bacterium]|nr:hypothetical protein [Gemmataceae bacterium]
MTDPTALEPFHPSMEWLLAEEGMPVTAGLPQGLRDDLDRVKAVQEPVAFSATAWGRVTGLVNEIEAQKARLAELQQELGTAVREYLGTAGKAAATPAATARRRPSRTARPSPA